jgi:prophage DNA circulation protein
MLDFSIQFTDLLLILSFIFASAIGILITIMIIKAINVLKKVEDILSENNQNINELMTALPQAVKSIDDGVQSIKNTVDTAGGTIDFISESVSQKGAVLSNADGIIDIVRVLGELARAGIHYYKKEYGND